LLDWLSWLLEARLLNRSSYLLSSCLVSSKQTSLLVRSIKRVDEWVDTSTVSTRRDTVGESIDMVTSKVGSVPVELEITMSGVMWVDKWVEVRINWCINIVIVNSNRSSLLDRSSNLYRGDTCRCRGLGNKGSSLLTSSSSRNMSSF